MHSWWINFIINNNATISRKHLPLPMDPRCALPHVHGAAFMRWALSVIDTLAKVVSRTSTVASIANLVRPTADGRLSHRASTFLELSWQHVATSDHWPLSPQFWAEGSTHFEKPEFLYPFHSWWQHICKNRRYLTASVHSLATSVADVYSPDVTSRYA